MKAVKIFYIVMLMLAVMVSSAFAIPELQIYVEDATYDTASESWVTTSSNFKLWVLGDVSATYNSKGILDVYLVTAFAADETGSIIFTPSTTNAVADPSTPSAPTFSSSGTGDAPITGDGTSLQSHGIYGAGISWASYDIGDFTLMDSPIGDYIDDVPTSWPDSGQINVYDVAITGYTMVHFDAYDHVTLNKNNNIKYIFAPFSHDATAVPEPGTLVLLGMGLFGIALAGRKK